MNPLRNPIPTASGNKISNGVNLATCFSLSRIVLSFIFMFCLLSPTLFFRVLALFLFILAVSTDIYDGIWARSRNMVTPFGILLDPLADKILVSAAFVSFVGMKEISLPAWMVVIIISREFFIMGLRLLASSQGKILSAERGGKQKTIWQMGAVILMLLYLVIRTAAQSLGFSNEALDIWARSGIYIIMSVVLILTITSGYKYLRKYKDVFQKK